MYVLTERLRDRMWIWATIPGRLFETSKMTPAKGAEYMGVPNIVMAGGIPPTEEEAQAVSGFKRIIWDFGGWEGWKKESGLWVNFEFEDELQAVQKLAQKYPNIERILLDDFTSILIRKQGMQPDVLSRLCYALQSNPRPLSLWGVVYTMNFLPGKYLVPNLKDYLHFLGVIHLWTWRAEELNQLEENFEKCEKLAGGKPINLGLYMYDWGDKRSMPIDLMKHQCELARQWIEERRLLGMTFLAIDCIEQGFDAVKWTIDWIRKVGDEPI